MKPDIKIKRALIDTPGLKEYRQGVYEYTPEVLELMSKDLQDQIVELDVHDGESLGDVVKMGYCPKHGLWADLAVPVDTPEDDVKFSSDVNVLETEMNEEGVKRLINARLNKVVWSTSNGDPVRNPETRLCNTDLEGTKMGEEDQKKLGELNVEVGQLKAELAQKEQAISAVTADKEKADGELSTLKESYSELEGEVNMRRKREENFKNKLLDEMFPEDDTLKDAYKTWSIPQLKALKKQKDETTPPEDTPEKGVKSKSVIKKPGKSEADKKPSYADLAKARKEGRF